MGLIKYCEVAHVVEHPDFYREGPGFESQRDHKISLQGANNKSFGAGIASRKGAGSPEARIPQIANGYLKKIEVKSFGV